MKNNLLEERFGFVSLNRACQILGMSKSWIYKATSNCILPHYKIGNRLIFKIDDLINFLEGTRINEIKNI